METTSIQAEYTHIPNHDEILLACEREILARLATQTSIDCPSICDTRSIHYEMFNQLIPHFAGKYRGEPGVEYGVTFGNMSGAHFSLVQDYMDTLASMIRTLIADFEKNASGYDEISKFYNISVLASWIVENFIRIHPYGNGNGHISRYIIAALFIPNQFCSKKWSIHHHPISDREYLDSMRAALNGDNSMLIHLLRRCF